MAEFLRRVAQIFCYFMVTEYKIEKISSFDFLKHFISGRKFVGEAYVQRLPNISVWRLLFLHLTFIVFKDFIVFSLCIYFLCLVQFSIFFQDSPSVMVSEKWPSFFKWKTKLLASGNCKEGVVGRTRTTNATTNTCFTVWTLCRSSPFYIVFYFSRIWHHHLFQSFSSFSKVLSLSYTPVAIAWRIEYEQSWESAVPTMVLHQFVGSWVNSRLAKLSS